MSEEVKTNHLTLDQIFRSYDWISDGFNMMVDDDENTAECQRCGKEFGGSCTISDLGQHLESCTE